jgi:hypothetical protein
MPYPRSGSLLTKNLHTSLSTQIIVKVGSATVGAIQRLALRQNRDLHIHEECGTDGIVEIHPKGAAKIEIGITRVVFDGLRLPEAFSRSFINIQAQRIAFDIHIIDTSNTSDERDFLVHTCHSCWFRQYSPTFTVESFIISEEATLSCEYITSMRNGQSAVYGGLRDIPYEYDSIEKHTDYRGERGRLDSSGLDTRD